MMRLTEEQKAILNCYEGGRTKILHEMRVGAEEIKAELQVRMQRCWKCWKT